MERLLKDAEAYRASMGDTVQYEIDNLADVYTAIGDIQEKLGIAGTTALEAEKTISGSAATMKAAWKNVLTAISGGGDLDRAIENLVDSISNYFENIVPVVERALSGIGRLIEKVAPMLVQTVAKSLIKAIPSLLNAVYEMIIGIGKGVYEGINSLIRGETIKDIEEQAEKVDDVVKSQDELTESIKETNKETNKTLAGFDDIQILSSGISEDADFSETSAGGESIASAIINSDETSTELSVAELAIMNFAQKAMQYLRPLFDWITKTFIPKGISAFSAAWESLGVSFEVLKQPLSEFWNDTLSPILSDIGKFITDILDGIGSVFSYVAEKAVEYEEEISTVIDGISAAINILWSFVSPIITEFIDMMGNIIKRSVDFVMSVTSAFSEFFSFIGNIFNGVRELFEGNTDGAIEYFKAAFVNFVNIFVSIANAIIDTLNLLWEKIFSGVQGFVNGLGSLVGKIGDFLGKDDWGWNWGDSAPLIPHIPKWIPKLAQGAVIPANREFLAVLGDQKQGTNIETPLATMVEAFQMALDSRGGYGGGNTEVVLEIDGREFGRAVVEQGNRENRRIGTRLVIG